MYVPPDRKSRPRRRTDSTWLEIFIESDDCKVPREMGAPEGIG